MPKARKYSNKRRHRRHKSYKIAKRGGMNTTDTLDALEKGNKYGNNRAPFTYNPSQISITSQPKNEEQISAVDFFEKASNGMAEQAKLEQKFREIEESKKLREEMLERMRNAESNPQTAEQVFSGLRPELQKEVDEYTLGEMEPFTYGQERGGKKSRKYKRKGRKSRKNKRSRRH